VDFGHLGDSLVLLVSGGMVALYGAGKLFPELANGNTGKTQPS